MQKYQNFYQEYVPKIEQVMDKTLLTLDGPASLIEAMRYSVNAGGKRLRPIMTLAIFQAFGGVITDSIIRVACAVELIHTYSLIHDDLPAMDNDDYRRGKPTSHKQFGEAQAILAGDGLLTLAFSWIAESDIDATSKVALMASLAHNAGPVGMVGGQVADMLGNDLTYTHTELVGVHNLKTGALLSYAALAGGILAHVTLPVQTELKAFGLKYGLAFQIEDDILDANDSVDLVKNTYPHLLGLAGAQDELALVLADTRATLATIAAMQPFDHELVAGLLSYFERKND
ncbi:polyprenyl synthetase family protein [Periweissella ghanensis]|uniref:Farnesyl diphosphate synthase n=1 Tax=Periweissella ghanensis TaxID=467997 RepID=A0ABN8BPM1_9LACO|nr:farnesyl diphosphate synthase [Periweissella ghanensis]MCM0600740.1 polyprenyl synthetase family protein [Periweissella ghanensis]CAH0418555.1 Farnesyl diphosphate synthase [Periweissella ghanensis]